MFCKYCGTQVPDGYICGCPDSLRAAQAAAPQPASQDQYDPNAQYAGQYAPNAQYGYPQAPQAPQQPAGPTFGQKLSQTLKNIPATFKSMCENAMGTEFDLLTSGVFTVGMFVLGILTWLFMFMGLFGEYMDYLEGSYGIAILTGVLVWLVPIVLNGLIPLFGQLIRKEYRFFADHATIDWLEEHCIP